MKTNLCLRLCQCFIFQFCLCASGFAYETAVIDGVEWKYTVVDGKVKIGDLGTYTITATIPPKTAGHIKVPTEIDGMPVVSVGKYSFWDCSSITSVSIPEGVLDVGADAFYGCGRLENVEMPASITNIHNDAFYHLNSIRSVTLPACVRRVSDVFGYSVDYITNVVLNAGRETVEDILFERCSNLQTVRLPDSVVKIDANAFVECTRLQSINIPKSVVRIGMSAFSSCQDLGVGVVSIDGCVIYVNGDCSAEVELPTGIRLIADGVFKGHPEILEVKLNEGLERIGASAFEDCTCLSTVEIPNSVSYIGEYAFDGWLCEGQIVSPETKINRDVEQTLVAQWRANSYKVRYRSNGGSGGLVEDGWVYGEIRNLRRNAFIRAGYDFVGWATSPTGGVVYHDCEPLSNLSDIDGQIVELWAVWKEGDAVDPTNVKFVFDGDAEWVKVVQGVTASDGEHSIRVESFWESGKINDGERSVVKARVRGAGTIGFWWRTDCELFRAYKLDHLSFGIDGAEIAWTNGVSVWSYREYTVDEYGDHELSWC